MKLGGGKNNVEICAVTPNRNCCFLKLKSQQMTEITLFWYLALRIPEQLLMFIVASGIIQLRSYCSSGKLSD